MSFQIERGLFKFDFTDHHAVLGIPIGADKKEVRKRYLKIARNLHPDSSKAEGEAEKQQANQLLSKLVNPAYEQLSKDDREYLVMLERLGKRLATDDKKVPIASEAAKKLFQAGVSLENSYKSSVNNLAAKQYNSLGEVLDAIAALSELNMVYLMLNGKVKRDSGKDDSISNNRGNESNNTPPPPPPPSPVDPHLRRAKAYIGKENFAAAVLELREGLKQKPDHSEYHSLLGYSYLKQKQVAMAKVHINKALQLNPKDETALKCKKFIESRSTKAGGSKSAPPKSPQDKSVNQSGGSGLFGKMFGGKKK
ncbi:MAG: tetratricopeptide repeat protein [Symploca sp. SIO1C4]|uniref:Tetratricopeptide repeat protein n=1 Tax=Symploca sp. SIO1C4 TaxID=2607765 RepID=A0A6B3N3M8_9CYAN|nr:tetratricopeptide repeat protein [Symploca sp. SIO1C4]